MFVVCINPDLEARMRFKETSLEVPSISKLHITGSLMEAKERLLSGIESSSVYISDHFERSVIQEFIQSSKETKGGQDSAYLLLLCPNSTLMNDINGSVEGVDGYLFSPYSAGTLSEAQELAGQLHRSRSLKRKASAIDTLLSSAVRQLDAIAEQMKRGQECRGEIARLRAVSKTLRALPEDLQSVYFERLIERLSAIETPIEAARSKDIVKEQLKPESSTRRVIVRRV